jgi:hypothetical protein
MDRNEKARQKLINNKAEANARDEKMIAAIKETQEGLPGLKDMAKFKQLEFGVNKKIQDIVLSKPNRIEPMYEYESDIEYQKLIVEKQKIMNDTYVNEKSNEIRQLLNSIKDHEANLISWKAQMKFMEGD